MPETIIIGAGLAGLSAAARLHEEGRNFLLLEAGDDVGGRVRTDSVEGHLLDRGFQVYLDDYETAGGFLDLKALDLRAFEPGALVWKNQTLRPIMDVFRRPGAIFSTAFQPVGSIKDKLLVAKLRASLRRKSPREIWTAPEITTEKYLREFGFSESMIDTFFRGFYGGIFLERELTTSSRMFEFTFGLFARGSATLPARGMQEIPRQIARRLPTDQILLNTPVKSIAGTTVTTSEGTFESDRIILAVDGGTASDLAGLGPAPEWNSTACLYFSAEETPIDLPIIALRGDLDGLVNSVSCPSELSEHYAPRGKALVSVSVLGDHRKNENLVALVTAELTRWFGDRVETWDHLRTYYIQKALPATFPGNTSPVNRDGNMIQCGDHTKSGSIEGAILSGLEAAAEILRADA